MAKEDFKRFFLSDREIYDGLRSARQQITPRILREFFLEKGVYVSERLSRDALIRYISSLNLDYGDIQFLIEQVTPASRKEKIRTIDLDCSLEKNEIREIIEELKAQRSDEFGEIYQPVILGDSGRVVTKVEYEEVDLSKTTMRQRRPREAQLDLESVDGKVRIRFPDNERMEEVADAVIKHIRERNEDPVEEMRIDLSHILDVAERTRFFIDIIANMPEMRIFNVTKVSVDSRLTDIGEDDQNLDKEDVEDEDVEEEDVDEAALKGLVHKAALQGSAVLNSETFMDLKNQGFYISRLGWQMVENGVGGSKLEFEAYFRDSPACRKFAAQVTGIYSQKPDGEYAVSKRKLTQEETTAYFKILEDAAIESYRATLKRYTNQ